MKFKIIYLIALLALTSCKDDFPLDADGMLITDNTSCYVSNFELLGADFLTVRTKAATIDTLEQTIHVEVKFGTDLKNLVPQFSLVLDAALDPKIIGKEDFSDLSKPREWDIVSGNRKVRKTYKVFVTVQQ